MFSHLDTEKKFSTFDIFLSLSTKTVQFFSSNSNVKFDKNTLTGFMLCVKFEIN